MDDIQKVALVASVVAYLRKTYPRIDGAWVVLASLVCGVLVYLVEKPGTPLVIASLAGLKLGLGAVGGVTLGRYMLDKRLTSVGGSIIPPSNRDLGNGYGPFGSSSFGWWVGASR